MASMDDCFGLAARARVLAENRSEVNVAAAASERRCLFMVSLSSELGGSARAQITGRQRPDGTALWGNREARSLHTDRKVGIKVAFPDSLARSQFEHISGARRRPELGHVALRVRARDLPAGRRHAQRSGGAHAARVRL